MYKKLLLFLLSCGLMTVGTVNAQKGCYTDQMYQQAILAHPEIAKLQAEFDKQAKAAISKLNLGKLTKTTDYNNINDTTWYDVPVVLHVIHDYGPEYISDDNLYTALIDWNKVYAEQNPDTVSVIAPFKKYIGKVRIRLHLATVDPNGNPTKGITRHRSYLTYIGGDQSKLDDWPSDAYVNIWFVNEMSANNQEAAAYAYFPSQAASMPWYDGVIALYNYYADDYTGAATGGISKTIPHELGHVFSLYHPWGGTNDPCVACGDDQVDDTPPTTGHGVGGAAHPCPSFGCTPYNLYDTTCNYLYLQLDTQNAVTNTLFEGSAKRVHAEYIITAAELSAANVIPDMDIHELAVYVSGKHSTTPYTNYTVNMGNTGASSLSSGFVSSGLTEVYSGDFTTASGWNNIIFSTPVQWDGTSNMVVEICFNNSAVGADDTVAAFENDATPAVAAWNTSNVGTAAGCTLTFSSANVSSVKPLFRMVQLGYYKDYARTDTTGGLPIDSIVNYPDTANSQNIMDYTYCARMFTKLQAVRMHQALNSNIALRNNLWSADNLAFTGALAARPDLSAVPEFNVTSTALTPKPVMFTCPGKKLRFINESWRDTISSVLWTFSNGASTPTSTSTSYVDNTFSEPGWVTVSLTATGNNTPSATVTNSQAVFVADSVGVDPSTYYMEFNPGSDVAKWPMFNYYNNEFRWQLANTGYYDSYCVEYKGYDERIILGSSDEVGVFPVTGTPQGDYDDLFSVPFNLSSFGSTGECNLDFLSAGTSRTSYLPDMNDSLEIAYSTDHAQTWVTFAYLSKGQLANNGAYSYNYMPGWMGEWMEHSINIPAAGRQPYVIFRFRYKPQVGASGSIWSFYSTGNNFYMDRIHISQYPAEVSLLNHDDKNIAVVPNPTSGNAYVIIKNAGGSTAEINVTDITGKVVYKVNQEMSGNDVKVMIPRSAISVKGVYMVQVVTGSQTHTEKLVSY